LSIAAFLIFLISFASFQSVYAQGEVKWRVFHTAEGAFSVEMPQEPQYMYRADTSEDGDGGSLEVKTQMYVAEGNYGTAYFAAYYSYPPGFIITDPKQGFTNMATVIAESMGGALAEQEETEFDGYVASDFLIRLMNGVSYRGKLMARSGRIYFIMAGASDEMLYHDEIERFFTSFRFKEFVHLPKHEFSGEKFGFSVKFPAEPVIDTTNSDYSTVYSLDTSSAVSYMVIVSPINEYFEIEHADTALQNIYEVPQYMSYSDTVLSVKKYTFQGYPAHEVVKMPKGAGQSYRTLYVLRDDAIYSFFVFLPKNMLHSAPVNEFFTSIKFLPHTKRNDIYSRKAGLILKDISSKDTLQRRRAFDALEGYEFREEEMPQLTAAFRTSYDDDTLEYNSTRMLLMQKFAALGDSAAASAIAAGYATLPENAVPLKETALRTLRSINSQQSLQLLSELLLRENLPSDTYDYAIYNKWNDTLNNYRYMFPKILDVFKKDTIGSGFFTLINTALDSTIITADAIRPYLPRLLKDVDRNLVIMGRDAAIRDSAESKYYPTSHKLITQAEILGRFTDDNSANERLQKLLKTDAPYLTINSIIALLKAGKTVEPDILKKVAADSTVRLALYRRLEEIDAVDKFPKEHYTQRDFSLSYMNEWLNDGESYSEKIEFVKEFEISDGETAGRYFLYKYMLHDEEGGEVWYAAMTGPQPLDKSQVNIEAKRTNGNWKKISEMSHDEHFKTLLEETLKWDKEEE
jgi:hypothetical protein